MNKKGNNASSVNWKRIVGIIAAIVVIIILILSLISCQKKKSNSDKPKERKVEEKDKKPKKKDKDDSKLEVVEEDVVIYSDFSNDTSTAKVTKTSNNTNNASKKEEKKEEKKDEDPVDETKPDIGDVTKAIVENTNTIALTFTVTDESTVEVKIGEEVLTAVEGQYKFVATENGSYTITATDENGNESTETVEVTELIDVDNIITRGSVDRGQYQRQWNQQTRQWEYVWVPGTGRNDYYRSTINVDKSDATVSNVRYTYSNRYSADVNTSTFVRDNGTYRTRATIGNEQHSITTVSNTSTSVEITSQNNHNNYYVYYEASKTTDAGTAKVTNVETVNFTS